MEKTLLRKYDLTLEQLSYEFINKCLDKKTLERIVRVLRSGEEGYFPDLVTFAENRLGVVASDSALIRPLEPPLFQNEIPDDVWDNLEKDLGEWENEMRKHENILSGVKAASSSNLPPVRSATQNIKVNPENSCNTMIKPAEKIKRDDYKKWDDFNVDEELIKIDIEDERKIEAEKKTKLVQQKKEKDIVNSKLNVEENASKSDMCEEEKACLAERAREKGNEYFKAQDYNMALAFYDESLRYKPTITARNNRAITYMKLGKSKEAINDCSQVLLEDPNNAKALMRRASCYQSSQNKEHWTAAYKDLELLIDLEPNNKMAQNDYQNIRKKLKLSNNIGGVRLHPQQVPTSFKATEYMPLLYYGPSTSSFRCEPHSMAHKLLTFHTCTGSGLVRCRCNYNDSNQNPLCRNCGERNLRNIKLRKKMKGPIDPSMCAENVRRECLLNNTNFFVNTAKKSSTAEPQPKTNSVSLGKNVQVTSDGVKRQTGVQPLESSQIFPCGSNQNEPAATTCPRSPNSDCQNVKMSVDTNRSQVDVKSNRSNLHYESPTLPVQGNESVTSAIKNKSVINMNSGPKFAASNKTNGSTGSKERNLGIEATARGDACYKNGDYTTALAYYSTSIKLHADSSNLLGRASANIKLGRLTEAVADCSRVLEMNPGNTHALMKRASAYSAMSDNNFWKLGLEDLELVISARPGDKAIQGDINALKETLLGRKKRLMTEPDAAEGKNEASPSNIVKKESHKQNVNNCQDNAVVSEKKKRNRNKKKKKQMSSGGSNETNGTVEENCNVAKENKTQLQSNIDEITDSNNVDETNNSKRQGFLVERNNNKIPVKNYAIPNSSTAVESSNKKSSKRKQNLKNTATKTLSSNVNPDSSAHSGVNIKNQNGSLAGERNKNEKSLKDEPTLENIDEKRPQTNGIDNKNSEDVPISNFQFFSRWEARKQKDLNFKERLSILQSIPPTHLKTVIGENLDAEMLGDLLSCLQRLAPDEPASAAEYLKVLPTVQRFGVVKLLLDTVDIQRASSLIQTLELNKVKIDDDVKESLT